MIETKLFNDTLNAVGEKFFSFEEFPNISRGRFPAGVCERAMLVHEKDLVDYGVSLTGKELEAMIVDFPALKMVKEWELIGSILASRFSSRIIKLIFNLFQYNCRSEAVWFLIKMFDAEADRRKQYPDSGKFFWDFGKSGDFFSDIKALFLDRENDLEALFRTYHIGWDTLLAMEIRRLCLEDAEYPLLLKNDRQLIYLIEKALDGFLRKAITNYIGYFDVLDSSDEVNRAILERMDEPVRSGKWDGFPEETRKKFTQWCFCHHLRRHTSLFPSKYKALSQYYEKVGQCYGLEGTPVLVIEFEKITVADFPDRPYSYFYHKEDFDREIKQWKEFEDILPSFLKEEKGRISARDYLIEEKEDSCIMLQYEGIGLLYIKELLDIKFGILPDFRKMKLE